MPKCIVMLLGESRSKPSLGTEQSDKIDIALALTAMAEHSPRHA